MRILHAGTFESTVHRALSREFWTSRGAIDPVAVVRDGRVVIIDRGV